MPHRKLEVGDTFTAKGGLVMEVEERNGALYTCVHRGTNWRGIYRSDGRYDRPAAPPDPNHHADFYEAEI